MTDFYDDIPQSDVDDDEDNERPSTLAETGTIASRGSTSDPAFGFLLALAVSIGLIPTLPANVDMRYTLAWGALAGVGVISWLLGSGQRIGQETPDNIGWGIAFGAMVSVPFVLFFFQPFGNATRLIFPDFGLGMILAYLVFVMPLAETLFFRGLLQNRLEFYIVGGLSGLWSIVLFFPVMWGELVEFPAVAVFLAVAMITLNMLYSYVHHRNGLAAAWVCQIVASVTLLFVPVLFPA